MARDIWVISDTHFGHTNILGFTDEKGHLFRGSLFSDVEEMNEKMIENWNNVVKDNDIVYHLGDVYFSSKGKVMERLKGRKRLILGNHDTIDNYTTQHFQKIMVWRKFPEFKLLLTHVPVHPSSLEMKVTHNIHGHIHDKNIDDERYINVGVEQTNYAPVNIEELRKDK